MALRSPTGHPTVARPSPNGREPRRAWGAATALLVGALLVAALLSVVLAQDDQRLAAVRDVVAIADAGDALPYYSGWVTYTGAFAWCAAAAMGLLTARTLGRCRQAALLSVAALLALILAVDDLYMLHDGVLRQLGVHDQLVLGSWAALGLAWALFFARDLARDPQTPLLVVAGIFFAHTFTTDLVGDLLLHEEATKFAASICWLVWSYRTSVQSLNGRA